MVGSPNFGRFVQGSAATGDGLVAVVRRELLADFREHNLSAEERAAGRFGSDDAPFSQKGIPTVGLYTGAGGPKSEAQASLFGGVAGSPYDPCYHRACDTIDNINRDVLEQNTRALVRALNAAAIALKRSVRPLKKRATCRNPNYEKHVCCSSSAGARQHRQHRLRRWRAALPVLERE
jgi:Zn-dependent M28 family amino/carboxypeptidase